MGVKATRPFVVLGRLKDFCAAPAARLPNGPQAVKENRRIVDRQIRAGDSRRGDLRVIELGA